MNCVTLTIEIKRAAMGEMDVTFTRAGVGDDMIDIVADFLLQEGIQTVRELTTAPAPAEREAAAGGAPCFVKFVTDLVDEFRGAAAVRRLKSMPADDQAAEALEGAVMTLLAQAQQYQERVLAWKKAQAANVKPA